MTSPHPLHDPLERRGFLGSALAFGALATGAAAASTTGGQASGSRIRFVRPNAILKDWERAKQAHGEFEAEFRRRAEAIQERLTTLDKKRQELKSFPSASPQARTAARALAQDLASIQYDQEELKRDRDDRRLRMLLSEYQQIQDASARWAKGKEVDAIFSIHEEEATDAEDLTGRFERAVVRQVLWSAKELDVTQEVVHLLNSLEGQASPASAPRKP
jgi:Skp family chaperone for outer membrane proteins